MVAAHWPPTRAFSELYLANFLIYLTLIKSVTMVDIERPPLTWGHDQTSVPVKPSVTVAIWTV